MIRKCLACVLFLFLVLNTFAFAQDDDLESMVDAKVSKMEKALKLTDSQADAIRPIVKNYISKREGILKEVAGEGVVDHVAVNTTLKALKVNEYQQLGKILTADQLNKWIDKENILAALNPDSPESAVDDQGASMTPTGVDFKY